MDGKSDIRAIRFRPGEAFGQVLLNSQQLARMSLKALELDPDKFSWEKRIYRYCVFLWRVNARSGSPIMRLNVSTLLETISEEINTRYPSRTRERLERALDRLHSHDMIAGWQYDGWDEQRMSTRGWVSGWQQAIVVIEAPDAIKDAYADLASLPPIAPTPARSPMQVRTRRHGPALADAPPPATFGQAIRRRRQQLNYSQMMVAEQLEISQGYLTKLERDQVKPSRPLRARIEAWLADDRPIPEELTQARL